MTELLRGRAVQGERPRWDPLLQLVGEDVTGWFMWMFEVELEDGRRVDAYKHQMTRRYIHLADDGTTFVYVDDDRYRVVDPSWLVDVVCRDYPRPASI